VIDDDLMEPGLFTEPERGPAPMDEAWFIGPTPDRWRFALVGEDGEYLVIYGHSIPDSDIPLLLMHQQVGYSPEEAAPYADGDAVQRRWCGWVTVCETHHPPLLPDDDCWSCELLGSGDQPDRWWWWGPRSEGPDVNKGRPGFFPVTIVDLEW
jgi:hypothetical protein